MTLEDILFGGDVQEEEEHNEQIEIDPKPPPSDPAPDPAAAAAAIVSNGSGKESVSDPPNTTSNGMVISSSSSVNDATNNTNNADNNNNNNNNISMTEKKEHDAAAKEKEEDEEEEEDSDALYSEVIPTAAVSDRFRNALARVQADPSRDVAAWSALITEAQILARDHMNAEHEAQLKLLESCYGGLLQVFPYNATYWSSVAHFFMDVSNPENLNVSEKLRRRAKRKLDRVFRDALGVHIVIDEGKDQEEKAVMAVRYGPCSSSIELWKLYIHVCVSDARAIHSDATSIREAQFGAYEVALERTGFVEDAYDLWLGYISNLKAYLRVANETNQHQEKQQLMIRLRSVYQRAIGIPMQHLDGLWNEYQTFETEMSEALAEALLAEHLPRLQHAKQVFLERKQYMIELKMNRLAVPPENTEMEKALLLRWQKRCAYERTNPERLSTSAWSQRIRQAYKDCVSVLTRHPEVWHEWASWESVGSCGGGPSAASEVYVQAERNLPDCALIVSARAELLESTGDANAAIRCYEDFVNRYPCSLGFVLLQKAVRRTKGIDAARKIFARARKVLVSPNEVEKNEVIAEAALTQGNAQEKDGENIENEKLVVNKMEKSQVEEETTRKAKGVMTWHVFAAHAEIELRLNGFREVASRIFELGLSKYSSFISCPPYIAAYAKILIEAGDEDNFRSLLERAISACEEASLPSDSQRMLWDLLLDFEYKVSRAGGDPNVLRQLEARRQRALGETTSVLPKILGDELARADGESAGLISGGLGRLLNRFELVGLVGKVDVKDDAPNGEGGRSDMSFTKRHHGHFIMSTAQVAPGMVNLSDRSKAARERMNTGMNVNQHQVTEQDDGIPEWLRIVMDALPICRIKTARPPPHLIEMALASLKNNQLPDKPTVSAPPMSGVAKSTDQNVSSVNNPIAPKRMREAGGDDSSDEEDAMTAGHGSLFRMRQRARQTEQA